MKLTAVVALTVAAASAVALAVGPTSTTGPTDRRPRPAGYFYSIGLRPAAAAVPPLRHRLTVDPVDRQPGNAAVDYLKAVMLMPADTDAIIDRALARHFGDGSGGRSLASDETLVGLLSRVKPVVDHLVLASRRPRCDWEDIDPPPMADELAVRLGRMRQLAQLLRVCAIDEADTLRTADAIATVRAEYALAANVAHDQPLVGGLVGVGIEALAADTLCDLMNRRDAVNLYWPLCALRRPLISLPDVWAGEQQYVVSVVPVLKRGRTDDVAPRDWVDLVNYTRALGLPAPAGVPALPAGFTGTPPEPLLGAAREYYARTRHLSVAEVAGVDRDRLYSVYELEQFHIVNDEVALALGLPVSQALAAVDRLPQRLKDLRIDPGNLAMSSVPAVERMVRTFASVDRLLAAMTAVEAVRSYAATHGGQLPPSLAVITDTPAPVNPADGNPFRYEVDGGAATISDRTSAVGRELPLVFTVTIRK